MTNIRPEVSPESYIAFVQHPDNPTEIEYGRTHAGNHGAPEVQALCGISDDEIERLKRPDPIRRFDAPVAQPPLDDSQPRMHYPDEVYAFLMGMSDDDLWNSASETAPPVPIPE